MKKILGILTQQISVPLWIIAGLWIVALSDTISDLIQSIEQGDALGIASIITGVAIGWLLAALTFRWIENHGNGHAR